jgi:hypothetical protein
MASEEEQTERRRLSRKMDRIERMLTKCIEADRELRKKERAEFRAFMEKFRREYGQAIQQGLMAASLNIEAEVNNVAFLHDVVFAFES